ncbi:nipblb, partial [Symbiodinium sp. KB8]
GKYVGHRQTYWKMCDDPTQEVFMFFYAQEQRWQLCPLYEVGNYEPEQSMFKQAKEGEGRGLAYSTAEERVWREFVNGVWMLAELQI